MDSPLLGLTLGMAVAFVAYAAVLPLRPKAEGALLGSREALAFKLAAGILVGLSVWARWESLDSTDIAVVLALGLLSVPVVPCPPPLLRGRHVERVTLAVWSGAALVVGGALLLGSRSPDGRRLPRARHRPRARRRGRAGRRGSGRAVCGRDVCAATREFVDLERSSRKGSRGCGRRRPLPWVTFAARDGMPQNEARGDGRRPRRQRSGPSGLRAADEPARDGRRA